MKSVHNRKTAALADVEMSEGLEEDGLHKVTHLESIIQSVNILSLIQ